MVEWDDLDELLKIVTGTEASRDIHFDLAVERLDKILKAVNELIGEERMEDFLKYPEDYIVYNVYSDNDE